MRNNILVAVLFCCSLSIGAQETGDQKFGTWALYFGTHRVSEKISLYTELELNHYEFLSNFNQFWAIGAVNYHFSERIVASVGYGYFVVDTTFPEIQNERNVFENRLFEQIVFRDQIKSLRIQHRYRLENRFIHGANGTRSVQRFRYRLQLNHPIYKGLFVNVMDEIFFNFQEPVFDQNRLFTGLGYRISDNVVVQAGYLKLHFTGVHFDRLQFILNINTDLRKTKQETNPHEF